MSGPCSALSARRHVPMPPAPRPLCRGGGRFGGLLLVLTLAGAGGGCIDGRASEPPPVPGGEVARGAELLRGYTCGGCHVIPGVSGADGQVGPPLTDWVERQYIAGAIWNSPENLIVWLMDPQAVEPGTAMPDMGVTEEEARHMAAYLYSLGDTDPLGPPHPFPLEWLRKIGHVGAHREIGPE